eukprot:g6320.t1
MIPQVAGSCGSSASIRVLKMDKDRLEDTMSLLRNLQAWVEELELKKTSLLSNKQTIQRHLDSPLIGVLDGGKALKKRLQNVKGKIRGREREKCLAEECVRVLRFLIEEQQAQRLVVHRMKNEITRMRQERMMKDSIVKQQEALYAKSDLQTGKSSFSNHRPGYIEGPPSDNNNKLKATPKEIREHNRVLGLDEVKGQRKTISNIELLKKLTPRKSAEVQLRERYAEEHKSIIPSLAMSKSTHFNERDIGPQLQKNGEIDSRLFSMAQAVYDPLLKKYVWVPMGIINEFDAMKMLLAGGQTPNKILAKKNLSNKWKSH